MEVFTTKEAILRRALELVGLPLGTIDRTGRLASGKGGIGNTIEENWFGIKPNNLPLPDFQEAEVELKATPFLRKRKGIIAKERLICNQVAYMTDYDTPFEEGSFYRKCKNMLLLFYEHRNDKPRTEYCIDTAVLYTIPDADRAVMEADWRVITEKIRAGRAHELSGRDTTYLSVCPKGKNSQDTTTQPCSPIPVMRRAYCLKTSYMTALLQNDIYGTSQSRYIVTDPAMLVGRTLRDFVLDLFRPYFGKTVTELTEEFSLHRGPKHIHDMICRAILRAQNPDDIAEFRKAGVKVKTITLEPQGNRTQESMSFPTFSFRELLSETFEESHEYQYFVETNYLFVVFEKLPQGDRIFLKALFWQLPEADIPEIKRVWELTQERIRKGVVLKRRNGRVENNLPKASESPIAHVRPHSKRSGYQIAGHICGDISCTDELPNGDRMTKQAFWFNSSYLYRQIRENLSR